MPKHADASARVADEGAHAVMSAAAKASDAVRPAIIARAIFPQPMNPIVVMEAFLPRVLYAPRMRAATCFLRDSTPGIQVLPSLQLISKARSTMRRLPSEMNWLPSAMMSVTMSRANS